MASEPVSAKTTPIDKAWKRKANWASKLSLEAQEILLFEKLANIVRAREITQNPSSQITYLQTRKFVVDSLSHVNNTAYHIATKWIREGIAEHQRRIEQTALMQQTLSR